ncbi:MAG: thiamine pyrophosphate-binding protein, partial [Synergistes sp.]|nr:thiamine pyrophosphate-binding protein [Synergistes sp.]
MKCGRILLEMLKKYNVEYVFGLPGETTLHWYDEWKKFPDIEHVMVRDERNAAFMADGYAKVSGKPGVCEGPSVGAPH